MNPVATHESYAVEPYYNGTVHGLLAMGQFAVGQFVVKKMLVSVRLA